MIKNYILVMAVVKLCFTALTAIILSAKTTCKSAYLLLATKIPNSLVWKTFSTSQLIFKIFLMIGDFHSCEMSCGVAFRLHCLISLANTCNLVPCFPHLLLLQLVFSLGSHWPLANLLYCCCFFDTC